MGSSSHILAAHDALTDPKLRPDDGERKETGASAPAAWAEKNNTQHQTTHHMLSVVLKTLVGAEDESEDPSSSCEAPVM